MNIFKNSKTKCVIVDRKAPQSLFVFLKKNNINYILSSFIKNTLNAVSTHPDMQICRIDKGRFVCEPSVYEYYNEKLKPYGVEVIKGNVKIASTYPHDISYNVVITEKFLMHNLLYTEESIKEYARNTDISIYNVKQGYTKCASCIIDSNAIITSDTGIYKICLKNGVDSLLIKQDKIKLGNRYDGFIGGCCGMIDYKKLLFCGDLSSHISYNDILTFANKYNVEVISSSDEILTDVGSIIPVD